jgi:trehalose 6-phosphate synthase
VSASGSTANRIDQISAGSERFAPVTYVERYTEPIDVPLLPRADIRYVGSLDDGMNLVAKEFVAARDDERGVLILSRFRRGRLN